MNSEGKRNEGRKYCPKKGKRSTIKMPITRQHQEGKEEEHQSKLAKAVGEIYECVWHVESVLSELIVLINNRSFFFFFFLLFVAGTFVLT